MNTETIDSRPALAETDSVTVAVVEAVADLTDLEPTELPPLQGYVDPDALAELFSPTAGRIRTGQVEFAYCGHRVTVRCDGSREISIRAEAAADADGAARIE